MSYQATVVKVNPYPHPNADNLVLANVLGTTVVIGKDAKPGELYLYFPTDGRLSESFAQANNLIGYKDPVTGERKGGYFSENRKIRSQKFRGQKSDGFACPLSYLSYAGDISDIKEGDSFDVFNGVVICEKYYTPATLRAINKGKEGKPGIARHIPSFAKHVDTEQFYKEAKYIPVNSVIWVTEKLHGTSGRTGKVWVKEEKPKRWYHKFGFKPKVVEGYQIVNGTRNVILMDSRSILNDKPIEFTGYYEDKSFRFNASKDWAFKLFEGEVVYYEIVGFTGNQAPIMNPASLKELKDKELSKKYGDLMHYSYGCDPNGPFDSFGKTVTQHDIYVYRITRTDKLGNTVEYSWPQVKSRCEELGIKYVPEIDSRPYVFFWNENINMMLNYLNSLVESYTEGSSTIDPTHIREGVVLRIDPPIGKSYWLKAKSFTFKLCEGMIKEDDNYVDMEEIS